MANFCCCLPLRLGVFTASVLHTLFYIISAAVVWVYLLGNHITVTNNGEKKNLDFGASLKGRSEVAVTIWAILLTIGAISSLVGFVCVITKRLVALRIHILSLSSLFGFHLIIGLITIAILATSKDAFVNECDQMSNNSITDNTWNGCNNGYHIVLFSVVGTLVVPLLLNLYAFWLARDYGKQLERDADHDISLAPFKQPHKHSKAASVGDGASHPLTDEQYNPPPPYGKS